MSKCLQLCKGLRKGELCLAAVIVAFAGIEEA